MWSVVATCRIRLSVGGGGRYAGCTLWLVFLLRMCVCVCACVCMRVHVCVHACTHVLLSLILTLA